jgi:excisionase family DNA binding protein
MTYLTTAQLCERWQIDRRTLYKLLGAPQLPVVRVNRRVWRVRLVDVERYERREFRHADAA